MPKTKFQNVIFTLMMSFLMVYAMICYNISLNIGGMSNQVFLMAFGEMRIMWPVAFILEFFLVDSLAHKLTFRMVTPQDRPIVITLAISIMIICIMCPIMSLIATILFKNAGSQWTIAMSDIVLLAEGDQKYGDDFYIISGRKIQNLETQYQSTERGYAKRLKRSKVQYNLLDSGSAFYGTCVLNLDNKNHKKLGYNYLISTKQ